MQTFKLLEIGLLVFDLFRVYFKTHALYFLLSGSLLRCCVNQIVLHWSWAGLVCSPSHEINILLCLEVWDPELQCRNWHESIEVDLLVDLWLDFSSSFCGTTSTEQAPGLQSYGQDEGGTAQLSGQPSGGFWTGQGLVNAPLFSFSRILISLNSVIYVGVNIHAHVYMIYIYTLHIK